MGKKRGRDGSHRRKRWIILTANDKLALISGRETNRESNAIFI